jgi:hypothetical protein
VAGHVRRPPDTYEVDTLTPPIAFAWRPILPWAGVALTIGAAGMALAVDLDAPMWLIGAIGLAPWLPLLAIVVVRTWRVADGWLALYLALVMTQVTHVGEHVVQIVQLRVLGLDAEHAHGVFGALDIEWVHFVWNAWILLAVGLLLVGFRRNRWLWLTLLMAAWHLGEHAVLIAIYLATGTAGDPGLLARGGLIGGGLPLARPDLHLLYNVAETLPLLIGFGWQWRQERPAPGDHRARGVSSDVLGRHAG